MVNQVTTSAEGNVIFVLLRGDLIINNPCTRFPFPGRCMLLLVRRSTVNV